MGFVFTKYENGMIQSSLFVVTYLHYGMLACSLSFADAALHLRHHF